MTALTHHLARTMHLLTFCIAPNAVSPDPLYAAPEAVGVVSGIVGAGLLYGVVLLARRVDTPLARVAGSFVWGAVAAAMAASLLYDGDDGPLGRGVFWVGPLVWAALATTAAAAAGEWLGSSFKHKRTAAAVIVLGAAAKLFGDASDVLKSTDSMWEAVAKHERGHERAVERVTRPLLTQGKHRQAKRAADRCLAVRPASCACLEIRAKAEIQAKAFAAAVADASAAAEACPDRASAKDLLAEARALSGEP